jgi:hypothetical protein
LVFGIYYIKIFLNHHSAADRQPVRHVDGAAAESRDKIAETEAAVAFKA